ALHEPEKDEAIVVAAGDDLRDTGERLVLLALVDAAVVLQQLHLVDDALVRLLQHCAGRRQAGITLAAWPHDAPLGPATGAAGAIARGRPGVRNVRPVGGVRRRDRPITSTAAVTACSARGGGVAAIAIERADLVAAVIHCRLGGGLPLGLL